VEPSLELGPPATLADGRRAAAHALLEMRGPAADPNHNWGHEKFVTRARALFYTRLAFLSIGLGVLAVPAWSHTFRTEGPWGFLVYLGMLSYSIANFVVVEHPVVGRVATFVTLCLDLLVLVYLTTSSGGLHSPLLATELLFTTLFAILFPKPLAIVPPLLTLPVVAKIDQILGSREVALVELLILLWYSAMNFIVVYVVVYLNEREDSAHKEVVSLHQELRELAVLEERNRLAREIHDGLGASLSSLIIQTEYIERLATEPELKKEIRELKVAAEESIDELRRSLQMMRKDFDLVQSLDDYCRLCSERFKFAVSFSREGSERPLGPEGQLTIFRILQESLTNAAKHAEASKVVVRVTFDDGAALLVVQDDGKGFDPKVTPKGHYGLLNMRERAGKIDGRVDVESTPGQGTRVALAIPYPPLAALNA
jgi:two-component system sensor histidine kinase DegS